MIPFQMQGSPSAETRVCDGPNTCWGTSQPEERCLYTARRKSALLYVYTTKGKRTRVWLISIPPGGGPLPLPMGTTGTNCSMDELQPCAQTCFLATLSFTILVCRVTSISKLEHVRGWSSNLRTTLWDAAVLITHRLYDLSCPSSSWAVLMITFPLAEDLLWAAPGTGGGICSVS